MFKKLFLTGALLFGITSSVLATGDIVANMPIKKLDELAATPAIDGTDFFVTYDASADAEKKLDASRFFFTDVGGTVTQITSRSTGVTLSKLRGSITTDTTSLAAAAEATFVVTNTLVAAVDIVVACIQSSPDADSDPIVFVSAVSAGSFALTISNLGAGADTGAIIINFIVLKGANS